MRMSVKMLVTTSILVGDILILAALLITLNFYKDTKYFNVFD